MINAIAVSVLHLKSGHSFCVCVKTAFLSDVHHRHWVFHISENIPIKVPRVSHLFLWGSLKYLHVYKNIRILVSISLGRRSMEVYDETFQIPADAEEHSHSCFALGV